MYVFCPITGDGSESNQYRPNMTEGVEWSAVSLPSRLDQTERRGEPVCRYALIKIADADASKVDVVPSEQVDETTKLVTTAMQAIRNPQKVEQLADKDNDDTPQTCFEGAQEERHRNKIDNSIIHRRRWARLLVRLCRRGFPIEKARHIVKKHGIDRDEHNRGTTTSR